MVWEERVNLRVEFEGDVSVLGRELSSIGGVIREDYLEMYEVEVTDEPKAFECSVVYDSERISESAVKRRVRGIDGVESVEEFVRE